GPVALGFCRENAVNPRPCFWPNLDRPHSRTRLVERTIAARFEKRRRANQVAPGHRHEILLRRLPDSFSIRANRIQWGKHSKFQGEERDMSDRMVSMHGIWRTGVAVLLGGLLLASTACPTLAETVTTGLWVANSGGPSVPQFSAGQTSRGSVSGPKPTVINMSGAS